MKKLFITNLEEIQELEIELNLEDCGMSGDYEGWHWYQDDEEEVAIYFKEAE